MTFKSKCALGFHIKACHPSQCEEVVVTPEIPAGSPGVQSNYVESNYGSCDGDQSYGGSAFLGYDEPEIDLCEANIKREIEVSETKFLPVSENATASEVDDVVPVSVTTYHSEVNISSNTVIKAEIDLPQTKPPSEVDLSPHTIIKCEIDEPES